MNDMMYALYRATIDGDLLGKVGDTQETKEAAIKLEGFVEGATNKETASRINELVADYVEKNGAQFFALGFEVAKRLFMSGKTI